MPIVCNCYDDGKMRLVRCCSLAFAAMVATGVSGLPTPAIAQEPEREMTDADRAAAQILFDEGRALMGEEKYEAACTKFAESFRLDLAVGTQLNLAACYEKLGRTASAWIHFVEVASRAKKTGQDKRVEVAEEHAAALKERLSYLTVVVPQDLDGLEIRRDGERIGKAQWGTAMPIDPGSHEVVARAPGKLPFKTRIAVKEEGSQLSVRIAPLADAPQEPEADSGAGNTGQIAGGAVALGLAAVGLGIGIGFGVVAKKKNDDSKAHCLDDDENRCFSEGVALRNDALTFAHVSTAGFVVAGVATLAGVVLLATLPSGADDHEPAGTPTGARLSVLPWLALVERTSAQPGGTVGAIAKVHW